ncbi:MAG: ion channel [Candidatus Omnitrophota bacterium]|nr:ion channel [Candidatus Omnitrophota bacterium]
MQGKGAFFYLLTSLLFVLLAYPVFEKVPWSGKMLALLFSGILVAGAYVTSRESRIRFIISISLAVPTVLFLWTDQLTPQKSSWSFFLDVISYSFMVAFTFYTAVCVLLHLMKARKVTADILAGAACAYFLLGLSWTMLYLLLDLVQPGSFIFAEHFAQISPNKWSVFNYYSFVTLTTLGYGEITPVTSRAQSFAILEAVTGVLFTALLISRLVGMYLYQLKEGNSVKE